MYIYSCLIWQNTSLFFESKMHNNLTKYHFDVLTIIYLCRTFVKIKFLISVDMLADGHVMIIIWQLPSREIEPQGFIWAFIIWCYMLVSDMSRNKSTMSLCVWSRHTARNIINHPSPHLYKKTILIVFCWLLLNYTSQVLNALLL